MDESLVLVERRGAVAVVTLNRAGQANALNVPLRQELAGVIGELGVDESVRALVVTGAGRSFCTGADLKEKRGVLHARLGAAIGFDRVPKPVIAAINGAALGGGCELALTCDFRFMADGAQIGLTEIRFGALPLGGGTARLPRVVGLANAKRMIYSGDPVDAGEAHRIGLADAVVPAEELLTAAVEFAEHLAERPAYALRTAKTLLNMSQDVPLATALELEQRLVRTMATPEEMAAARAEAARQMPTYANIFARREQD